MNYTLKVTNQPAATTCDTEKKKIDPVKFSTIASKMCVYFDFIFELWDRFPLFFRLRPSLILNLWFGTNRLSEGIVYWNSNVRPHFTNCQREKKKKSQTHKNRMGKINLCTLSSKYFRLSLKNCHRKFLSSDAIQSFNRMSHNFNMQHFQFRFVFGSIIN